MNAERLLISDVLEREHARTVRALRFVTAVAWGAGFVAAVTFLGLAADAILITDPRVRFALACFDLLLLGIFLLLRRSIRRRAAFLRAVRIR